MLDRGAHVWGVEHAAELVDRANRRLGDHPGFHGVVQAGEGWSVPQGVFDVVVATEVIEHLPDRELAAFFDRARAALRPGGLLVLTTPNDEDLANRQVLCPDCGALFHPMQHVRAWTWETLGTYALSRGIQPVAARVTALHTVGGVSRAVRLKSRVLRFTLPARSNLLFAGRRAA